MNLKNKARIFARLLPRFFTKIFRIVTSELENIMKFITSLLASMLVLSQGFSAPTDEPAENWRVIKNSPLFSTSADFDFKNGNSSVGRVVRTGLLCPRYYYDLYSVQDNFEARGITRFFSLGFLFSWGVEIDIYDASSRYLGLIQGQTLTKARAKFMFYGPMGETRGIAYLNSEKANLLIVSPLDESVVLAELTGDAYGDVSSWAVKLNHRLLEVDSRLLKIFSAFVADYHSSFKEPPKEVYHYNFNYNYNQFDFN